MTLQQFKYALALRDTGHFLKAAEQCFVTQPTLSQQIQKLEEHLGIVLFDRSRQPILPTHDGEAILAQISRVIAESQRVEELVAEAQGEVRGEFRLGVIPTLAPYLLPRFLPQFRVNFPRVQLRVEELQTEQVIESLVRGNLDSGLVVTPLQNPNILETVLFYEPIWLYLSRHHPLLKLKSVKERDLSLSDIYLLSEGHCFRSQVMSLCRSRAGANSRSVSIESGSLETVKRLVDQGEGSTLLPELAVQDLVSSGQKSHLRPFVSPQPLREVSLVYYRHSIKLAIRRALEESVKQSIPDTLLNLKPQKHSIIPIG